MKNTEVYIVSAVRTAIGSFNGSLSAIPATQLGAEVIKAAIQRGGISPEMVDEVFMGNVMSANLGQAPARQAALFAGLPVSIPCTTVNKVCSSGLKSVMLGTQSILLGDNEIVVAGGMESMSNVPHYISGARKGMKLGHGHLTDGMIKDGLWDVYNDFHMGSAADNTAKVRGISRQEQDELAVESYRRAAKAVSEGKFAPEIVPIEIKSKKGVTIVDQDEEYKNVNFDRIPFLSPVFNKDGTVTAANASTINDGAAALVLMSREKANALKIKPLVKIMGYGDAAREPEWFTTAPSLAIPKAVEKAGLNLTDIDFFEINEAFAVVALAVMQDLNLDPSRVNIWGSGVSMGHPLGATGARILVTLINVLTQNHARFGVAGLCNGGGGASAVVVENLQF
ncbi:MAG: acetyl-CoA C-acyltransferase [Sphingobacteriia bacterium]|nr:acetyl-CoA C-acyltransferase [Sphingobacteriia bacterium]